MIVWNLHTHIQMKGIRFANVIVWKWWYKPINMLVFSQYFSSNVPHLSDSIYNWTCCLIAVFKLSLILYHVNDDHKGYSFRTEWAMTTTGSNFVKKTKSIIKNSCERSKNFIQTESTSILSRKVILFYS